METVLSRQLSGLGLLWAIRRRLWTVIVVTALVMGATAAYTFLMTPVHRASMKIVVGQGDGIFLPEAGSVAEQFTLTMSTLIPSEEVAGRVIAGLDVPLTSDDLLGNLDVTTRPSTAVVEVTYDDTDPDRAVTILDEVAQIFPSLVAERLVPQPTGLTTSSTTTSNEAVTVTVFDPPHLEEDPVAPKPYLYLVLGGFAGLFLGAVTAVMRDRRDDTIRSIEEAEDAFGQPTTAVLPRRLVGLSPLEDGGRRRVDPTIAELAFQKLRAAIMWSWGTSGARSIVVTSPAQGEGKSTVAANLAVGMAVAGHDVVLVDADLRKPSVATMLGMEAPDGVPTIEQVAAGQAPVVDALVEVSLEKARRQGPAADTDEDGRLRVILARPGSDWSGELDLEGAGSLVRDITAQSDYVIFDCPPLGMVADTFALAATADAVIAVVRNGSSSVKAVAALSRILARVRIRQVRRGELVISESDSTEREEYYSYDVAQDLDEGVPQSSVALSSSNGASAGSLDPPPLHAPSDGIASVESEEEPPAPAAEEPDEEDVIRLDDASDDDVPAEDAGGEPSEIVSLEEPDGVDDERVK